MRRWAGAVVAVFAMSAIAGCQQGVPQVDPLPKAAEPPVIVESGQVDRILKDLSATLDQAATDQSAEPLGRRVGGAALAMMDAQFKAKKANPDQKIFELKSGFLDGQIVTRSASWPRSFVVVTEYEDAEAPFIYQIRQDGPRDSYKLVAWAKMLPGADMPAASPGEVGSAEVGAEEDGLAMTPRAALQAYAIAKGDMGSEDAALFDTTAKDGADPDPTRAYWTALVTALTTGATTAPLTGTVKQTSELVGDSVFAVATADAGALVFGQIKSTIAVALTPVAGGSVDLGSKGYTGLGAATLAVTKSATIEHLQTVVLAVPPAGADGPVRVIAVADTPTAVEVE
jgi:hypothetical protein